MYGKLQDILATLPAVSVVREAAFSSRELKQVLSSFMLVFQ